MEPTLFQVDKQAIFPQYVQDLPHGFHMTPSLILNIDKDVIQIQNDKNIELLYQDLVDITLEACWGIRKSEKLHLVLKITVSDSKSHLPLVTFLDPHSMIDISQIQLGKSLCST